MHWNHRVLAKRIKTKKRVGKDLIDTTIIEFGLYEVFYDDNNNPDSCTEESMNPRVYDDDDIDDPIADLKTTLEWMRTACDKPVLDYDNFPNEYVDVKRERRKKMKKINAKPKKK